MSLLNNGLLYIFLSTLIGIFNPYSRLEANELQAEKPLTVVVVSYNNINWYQANITSILNQKYSNYRVVYVDDCSTDGTADAVENLVRAMGQENRFTLVRNDVRSGSPLANHYKAITNHCKDEEIVLCVDGDDWLANDQVLNTINDVYSSNDVWLTHGTLAEYHLDHRNGWVGWSLAIPPEVVQNNTFREFRCATHLKTFYVWLFNKIKYEDLLYEGKFYPAAGDQALIFPMIEMAGERHAFIPQVLYIYNMINPIGENRVLTNLQQICEAHVRQKTPYKRLDCADPIITRVPEKSF